MKRTSTSLARDSSGSYFQSGRRCQPNTTRSGGSHSITRPHSHSVPSAARSNHRPPAFGSTTASTASFSAMWCVASGHHVDMPSVKSVNARSFGASTTMLRRTARSAVC